MSNPILIEFGSATFAVPTDCPRPDQLEAVFRQVLAERFGSDGKAADAFAQWRSIRVPEPFASNEAAAGHYRRACLALNPEAQSWEVFQDELFNAFLDFDEDGKSRMPPIPGWSMASPDFVS